MGLTTVLLAAALVAAASAGPAGLKETCSSTCSDVSKFAFEKGMKYEYDYTVDTTTKDFPLENEDNAAMSSKAKATISVIAPCEFVLQLSDVSLEGSSHSAVFSEALTKSPLRFGFDDGKVTDVCIDSEAEAWATNFKRGIISMFQNTMDDIHKDQTVTDTDITGECETEYSSISEEAKDLLTVNREKSFDSCKRIAMSSHTTLPSALQKVRLVVSKETCNQKIEAGIMQEVTCEQNLLSTLNPLSGSGSVVTTVKTSLTFKESSHGISVPDFQLSTSSLEFDGSEVQDHQQKQRLSVVVSILAELDQKSKTFVESEIPALFTQLVENLRFVNEKEMKVLYETNRPTRVWRFLVDAAPMVATPASFAVFANLFALGQVTSEEADVWFSSMVFIPNPEADMFTHLPNVLRTIQSKKALLGVSAMINTYCNKDSACMERVAIRELISVIESNLGSGCRVSSLQEKEKVLLTLKALGNAGQFNNPSIIETCYSEETNPDEIKVAALEAWRKVPCSYERSNLMSLYSDPQQDSELRITAYLSMMACPNEQLIDTIKGRLMSEKVNQVGSFVWTHLTNLQETASNEKQWIRELIGEDMLANKFNTSALKFSRNFESSFYMEEQGFGSTLESNVIFSGKSFLPRSAMVNLTVDLFGEPMNMLEIGGRMEGFESLIEKFFGSNGYYPEETVEAIIRSLRQSTSNQETSIEQMLDVITDEQEGSYYVRMFGNDVQYHHFRGLENFFDRSSEFNIMEVITELARTGNVDHTKSFKFIDTELIYPTIAGLPVSLKVNGSATIGLRMDGGFEVKSLRDLDVHGHIYPSAAVQVETSMTVDAHVSKFGRKMKSNVRTSTFVDGKIKIEDGKLADISLKMPHEKTEVFSFSSEKLFIEDDREILNIDSEVIKEETDSKSFDPLGLSLRTVYYSGPNFYKRSFYLLKTDTQSSYDLKFEKQPGRISFLFDTPESITQRKISFEFVKSLEGLTGKVEIPYNKLSIQGTRVEEGYGMEYSMELVRGDEIYNIEAVHKRKSDQLVSKLETSLKIEIPTRILIDHHGLIETNTSDRSIKVDVVQKGLYPATFKYLSSCTDSEKKMESKITSDFITATASGTVNHSDKFVSQFDAKYSIMKQPEQTINQYMKYQKMTQNDGSSYSFSLTQNFSQLPMLNFETKGKFALSQGRFESSTSLNYNENMFDVRNENIINFDLKDESKSYDIRMSLISKSNTIDALFTEKFTLAPTSLFRESNVRLTPDYEIKTRTELGFFKDVEGYARNQYSMPGFASSHEISFTKISSKYYTAKVMSKVNEKVINLDGSFQDKSQFGQSVDMIIGTTMTLDGTVRKADLALKANPTDGIIVDGSSNLRGVDKYFKLRATQTNVNLESNLVKPLLLKVKVTPEGPTRSVEVTGRWDSQDLNADLTLQNKKVSGSFKFGDIQKSFNGEISNQGLMAEVYLSSSEVIKANVNYQFTDDVVFSASLDTPFETYEKQDLTFSFKKLASNSIESQLNLAWRNSQMIALSTKADMSLDEKESALNILTSITCDREFFGFERVQFTVSHKKIESNIDSVISAVLDGAEIIKGKFEGRKSDRGNDASMTFKSPFTKDFASTVFVTSDQKEVNHKLEYGTDFLNISSKRTESGFSLNLESINSFTDNLKFTLNTLTEGRNITSEFDGKYGEEKMSGLFNMTFERTDDGLVMENLLRVITPFMTPIKGSFSYKESGKKITMDCELTRFWTGYGSIKIHHVETILSENIFHRQFSTSITSPDNRASFDSMLKADGDNGFEGYTKGSYNGVKFVITGSGVVDIPNQKAIAKGSFVFEDETLFKFGFETEKVKDTQVTKLKTKLGEDIYNIHHELLFWDESNWTNKLHFNDIFVKNIMTLSPTEIKHSFDWNKNEQYIRGELEYLPSAEPKVALKGKVSSSEFKESEFDLTYEETSGVHKPVILMKYGDDQFEVSSEVKYTPREWSVKSKMVSSFLEDISIAIQYLPQQLPTSVMISFAKGNDAISAKLSGDSSTADLEIDFNLPSLSVLDAEMKLGYDISKSPLKINGALVVNKKEHSFSLFASKQSFGIKFDIMNYISKLESSWDFSDMYKTFLTINAESIPINFISELKFDGDFIQNMYNVSVNYNGQSVLTFLSTPDRAGYKVESKVFYGLTTWYEVKANISGTEFTASFSSDDDLKLNLSGNYYFTSSQGNCHFTAKTTFDNAKEIVLGGNYNIGKEIKITLNGNVDEKTVTFSLNSDLSDSQSPIVNVQVTTFLEEYKTVGVLFTYDITNEVKTVDTKLHRNSEEYTIRLEAKAGRIVSKFTTPFSDYKTLEYGLEYKSSGNEYEAQLYREKNSVKEVYDFDLQIKPTTFTSNFRSSVGEYKKITLNGKLENEDNKIATSFNIILNDSQNIIFESSIKKDMETPEIALKLSSPYSGFESLVLSSKFRLQPRDFEAIVSFTKGNQGYKLNMNSKQAYKQGEILFKLETPIEEYNMLSMKGEYNFLSDIKMASLVTEKNGVVENLSVNLEVNNNHVVAEMKTPFSNFETISFEFNLTSNGSENDMVLKGSAGSRHYELVGSLDIESQYFNLRTTAPYGKLVITGRKTLAGYEVNWNKDGTENSITFEYSNRPSSGSFRLQTPMEGYKNIFVSYEGKIRSNSFRFALEFVKDDFKIDVEAKSKYQLNKSNIHFSVSAPKLNQDVAVKAQYDFSDNQKTAKIVGKYNELEEKMEMSLQYEATRAILRLSVPFVHKEVGAEYNIDYDIENKNFNALVKGIFEEESYEFTASCKINEDNVTLLMTTPFNNIKNIESSANIDYSREQASVKVVFDEQEISAVFKYALKELLLEIVTPFDVISHLKLSTNMSLSQDSANLSSEFIFRDIHYKLALNGVISETKVLFGVEIKSPFEGFRDINILGKIDLENIEKSIELSLQNGKDVKIIALSGKFVDDEIDMKVRSPFSGFENFSTNASLNRSKRSLEFAMMNDRARTSLSANFNSLDINVKTPYSAARESSFSIKKTDSDGYELHYKRNENFIDLTINPSGRRNTFNVEIKSAFPGWEYLALAGRLDRDDLIGYLSGQLNESKMTINGGGTYGRTRSDLSFKITTPYTGYENLTFKLKTNQQRRQFNFDLRSTRGDFRIIFNTSPNFKIDVYVPNAAEPTIIDASLTVFKGHIKISSRFSQLRTFNYSYKVEISSDVLVTYKIELNGLELLNLEYEQKGDTSHFKLDARRGENHSMIHYHRVRLETIEFVFNRNGKEFKVEASGSGDLDSKAKMDIVINNSFRRAPRTVTGTLTVDRSGSPKKIHLEMEWPGSRLYVVDAEYNINLRNPKVGDLKLSIVTPERRARIYNNMFVSWDFTNSNNSMLKVTAGRINYEFKGRFGPTEGDFSVVSSGLPDIVKVKYHFRKSSQNSVRTRDYYIGVSSDDWEYFYKLSGTASWLTHGDITESFQLPMMRHPVETNIKWKRDNSGLSGTINYSRGPKSGTLVLNKLKISPSRRMIIIDMGITSNLPELKSFTLKGEISFNEGFVVKMNSNLNGEAASVNFNIGDISSTVTEQTANLNIPSIGNMDITFGHDFRNRKSKTFTITANTNGQESYLKAEWNRNKNFSKLNGKVEAKSIFLGDINVTGNYDIRNIHNAKAEFHYKRNSDKYIDISWKRVYNSPVLSAEVIFESHFERLPVAKILLNGNFERDQFKLDGTLQLNQRISTVELSFVPKNLTMKFTSPRAGFTEITASLTYDFSNNKLKVATLHYSRENIVVHMDLKLEMPSKRSGTLSVNLTTPFEIVKTLTLNASWKNRKGEVHYTRNDIQYHFNGVADVKSDRQSFEVTFNPENSSDPIKIALDFNMASFIRGRGNEPEDIAKVELEMFGKRVAFKARGMRNSDRVMVSIEGDSTLDALREFKIVLDSELSTVERDGLLEFKLNERYLRLRNHLENRSGNGYYFRSEIDSSLTDLPGIVVGFGREGNERIFTFGVGQDAEITFSISSSDNFKTGFSGKLSLPRRRINDASYDVNYSFSGDNVLNVDTSLELEPGKKIETDLVYNSDGVRGRLSSPYTGRRSIRARRSISDSSYFVDLGVDDYSITLFAKNIAAKKGFVIEGEVFGRKISIDTLFNLQGLQKGEGRFLVNTSIEGLEHLGTMFTYEINANKIQATAEFNVPSHVTPKVIANINLNLENKLKGFVSLDVAGQVFATDFDLVGDLTSGYSGKLNIKTPFHVASEVILTGSLKLDMANRTFDSTVDISYPQGSKTVTGKYSRESDKINASLKINNESTTGFAFKLDIDRSAKKIVSELYVFEREVFTEVKYTPELMSAKITLDSAYLYSPIQLFISQAYTSTGVIALEASYTNFSKTHSVALTYEKSGKTLSTTLVGSSPIIYGRKSLSAEIIIPENFWTEKYEGLFTYQSEDKYDLSVRVDGSEGFKIDTEVTLPNGVSKAAFAFMNVAESMKIALSIEYPGCTHGASVNVTQDITSNSQGDTVGNLSAEVSLTSCYLSSSQLIYSVTAEMTPQKNISYQKIVYGGEEHVIGSGYSYTNKGYSLEATVDTSLMGIGKLELNTDLRIGETKRITVKFNENDTPHLFDLKVNPSERSALVLLRSPYLSGGVAKCEITSTGESYENMNALISLKFAKKTLSTKLDVVSSTMDDVKVNVEVKTPFSGYRKLNMGGSYRKTDFVLVNFFADKPLGYKFQLKTGKADDSYTTELEIETPFKGFETVYALVDAPVSKIAPKVLVKLPETEYGLGFTFEEENFSRNLSGQVNFNGSEFSTGIDFRYKSPYEISYFAKSGAMDKRFHIMMDSSLFNLVSLHA